MLLLPLVQVAPEGITVWNPGFDVTPAALISGIITGVEGFRQPRCGKPSQADAELLSVAERGVIYPTKRQGQNGQSVVCFDAPGYFQQNSDRYYSGVSRRIVGGGRPLTETQLHLLSAE
jgi:hypothetical protein